MGWQDAPMVGAAPSGSAPRWQSAPMANASTPAAPSSPEMSEGQKWGEAAKNVVSGIARPLARAVASPVTTIMDAAVQGRAFVENPHMPSLREMNPFSQEGRSAGGYTLPSDMFEQSLDSVSRPPDSTAGRLAEIGSTIVAGAKLPVPTISKPAPKSFSPPVTATQQVALDAQREGLVVPPSSVNPSFMNNVLEGAAGKTSTATAAAAKNQEKYSDLARRALDLPKGTQINKATLAEVRTKAGAVYGKIGRTGDITPDDQFINDLAQIGRASDDIAKDFPDANVAASAEIKQVVNSLLQDKFSAKGAMEYLKTLRHEAQGNLAFNVTDPSRKAVGLAQREAAATLEELIGRHLTANGQPELAAEFEAARRMIAKSYSVENALNETTGNIVASKLGSQLRRGKPLSGELDLIARFSRAFPKASKEINESYPVISPWDVGFSGASSAVLGNPAPLLYPLGRTLTREGLLSKSFQQRFTMPQATQAPTSAGIGASTVLNGQQALADALARRGGR